MINRQSVLFFAIGVLIAAGTLFWAHGRISDIRLEATRELVLSDWSATQFALRFEQHRPIWLLDGTPSQAAFVKRVQELYVLADHDGKVLQHSPRYEKLGLPMPPQAGGQHPRIWEATTAKDRLTAGHYVFCSGQVQGPGGVYELTVGRVVD